MGLREYYRDIPTIDFIDQLLWYLMNCPHPEPSSTPQNESHNDSFWRGRGSMEGEYLRISKNSKWLFIDLRNLPPFFMAFTLKNSSLCLTQGKAYDIL